MDAPRRRGPDHPEVDARPGLRVTHPATGIEGAVVEFRPPLLVVRDDTGRDHHLRHIPGGVVVGGRRVTLRLPRPGTAPRPTRTASGSFAVPDLPARVARAGRIWVEGRHDAELLERVWGDDLRAEGVVVEPLGGADELESAVRAFGPGPRRRLGILLDHLVEGSKEARLAAAVDHPDVLVVGHPYVDVWQAIRPAAAGIAAWPEIPPGVPWKQGVLAALGVDATPREFWAHLLGRVRSWRDLETPLIGAVERLIDFVAPPDP
ncbi:MAG: DUF3097 family protein [Actinomyces sp.]|nr:MAG: DUF3097 family protein [Actinomyces sp.]